VSHRNCWATQSGDNCRFAHHLRATGFSSRSGSENLRHAFGGVVDVAQGNCSVTNANAAPSMNYRGSSLTQKPAAAIDIAFDDGNPATGTFRCRSTTSYDLMYPVELPGQNCMVPLRARARSVRKRRGAPTGPLAVRRGPRGPGLQRLPHLDVALGRPDARVLDAYSQSSGVVIDERPPGASRHPRKHGVASDPEYP